MDITARAMALKSIDTENLFLICYLWRGGADRSTHSPIGCAKLKKCKMALVADNHIHLGVALDETRYVTARLADDLHAREALEHLVPKNL